jgi:hypothetical protein
MLRNENSQHYCEDDATTYLLDAYTEHIKFSFDIFALICISVSRWMYL